MRHRFRYCILALLFAATTINYIDRSVIGVLAPTLRDHVFGWTVQDYSYITTAFQLAYAIGLLTMGSFVDRVGVRVEWAGGAVRERTIRRAVQGYKHQQDWPRLPAHTGD